MLLETIKIQNQQDGQTITIPKILKIEDSKVYIKKVGNTLFIIPFHNPWQNLIDSLDFFTSDFMEQREQPEQQSRENFE